MKSKLFNFPFFHNFKKNLNPFNLESVKKQQPQRSLQENFFDENVLSEARKLVTEIYDKNQLTEESELRMINKDTIRDSFFMQSSKEFNTLFEREHLIGNISNDTTAMKGIIAENCITLEDLKKNSVKFIFKRSTI